MQIAFAKESNETSPETAPPVEASPSPPGEGVSKNHKDDPDKRPTITLPLPAQSHADPPGLEGDDSPPEEGGDVSILSDEDPFPLTYERLSHASTPTLAPNESTGSLQYTIPIITPPGRNGLEPKLELVYDSSFSRNEYLGLGWSTNIPYIERINREGSEHLHTGAYFTSSLDGELRVASSIEEMSMGGGQELLLRGVLFDPEEGGIEGNSAQESVTEQLEGKTASERADIKGTEIAKIGSVPRTKREDYDIEIVSMNAIDRGVEVFARAWDANTQIGFGQDGTVDIERFRIFNPPILVDDPSGTIVREWEEKDLETGEMVTKQRTLREDPLEAIFQVIEHNLSVMKNVHDDANIVEGKIGRTTSTFYPDAHTESTSVDGFAAFDGYNDSWANIHSATTSDSANDTNTVSNGAYTGKQPSQLWLYRAFFLFDTSAIGSDTVDSATFSLYTTSKVTSSIGNEYVSLVNSTPASNTAITTADFDQVGTTKLAPDLDTSSITTDAYNTWLLNSTGLGTINSAGVSKFALRHGNDIANSEPSGTGYNGINGITWADISGSSQDPKLVVEHFTPSTPLGLYGPLVENGDFRKYEFTADGSWEVTDKFGTLYTFGASSTSRQHKTGEATTTFKWMLEEVRDLNDNYISYEYFQDKGQIYPSKIKYTGQGSTDGPFEVSFDRTYNPDVATSSAAGFPVKTDYKISAVHVSLSGELVRSYAISYANGYSNINLLLSSITESGRDESGATTTLPAITFDYNDGFTPAWTLDTQFATSAISRFIASGSCGVEGWRDLGARLFDLNADGYSDIYGEEGLKFNNTNRGWSSSSWSFPLGFTGADADTQVIDANGDGLPDLFRRTASHNSSFLHNSAGWTSTTSYQVPAYTGDVRFGDINGDGLTDIIENSGNTRKAYINNGGNSGWHEDVEYVVPADFYHDGSWVLDMNKDGLDDLVISVGTSTGSVHKVYLNKGDGTGWEFDARYTFPDGLLAEGHDSGNRLADVTNDGYPDMIRSVTDDARPTGVRTLRINNGDGTGWGDYVSITIPKDFANYGNEMGLRFADVNGDGILDLIEGLCDSPTNIKNVYSNTGAYGNSVNHPDLLAGVTSATGEQVTVEYLTTPLYKDTNNALYNPNLPLVLTTVSQIVKNDGLGNISTTTYSYSNGEYFFAGPLDRKFAGFASTTKTDSVGNVIKTYFHQGSSTQSSIGEYSDHFSKIGKPYRVEVKDSASNFYTKTINKWENVDLGDERNFVKLTQIVKFAYDGDADHRETGTTIAYDDENGNITETVEYGEVIGSDDGTFTDTGTDKRTTTNTYAASTTLHILGLPSRELLVNQASSTVKDTKHYYDSLSSGNVSIGNETKTEFWKSGSSYASTTRTYNSYGLLTQTKDGLSNATTYTYDSLNLYVATSTNALSQATGYQYDYTLGKPKLVIDANNRVSETAYDGLDRPVTQKQPDLTTPSTLVTKKTYAYTDTQGSRKVAETNYLDGSTDFTLYTYLDGMDRTIQTRREAETSNRFSVRDFDYNPVGLLEKESLPYFSSGSARTTATATSSLYTTYAYDALGRATTTANAAGTTTQAYDDWTTTITDPNGNIKKLTNDAYSRLATVVENDSTTIGTTTYAWYANDTLATTTDADGNVRNFTYDGRGLRLTAQDLHDTADATFGTWDFTYDNAGNLTSFLDPKSQTVNLTYDSLNRVLSEDFTGQGGTEIEYDYDGCTDGASRLCIATSTGAVVAYKYNALGLQATTTTTISTSTYVTGFRYDRQGNLSNVVYPDNSEVQYTYNTAGFPETVQQKESGGSFADIVSDFDYGPHGQVTYKLFGNGVESTYTFDASALYRLQNILTVAPEGEGFGFGGGESESLLGMNPPRHPLAISILETPDIPGRSRDRLDDMLPTLPNQSEEPASTTPEAPSEVIDIPDSTPDDPPAIAPIDVPEIDPAPISTSASEEQEAPGSLQDMLEGKTAAERAAIKSAEIAKIGSIPRTNRGAYDIEVTAIEVIDGGVQVFARAWNEKGQIGFGSDGTVDIERFRIFNPPILVDDPQGTIARTWEERDLATGQMVSHERKLREDPLEAVFQVIEHNLSVMQNMHDASNIVPGKIGQTTSTFYPDAHTESTSVDGFAAFDTSPSSWSTVQSAATSDSANDTNSSSNAVYVGNSGGNRFLYRAFYLFDTAGLGDNDVIDSATFNLYVTALVTFDSGSAKYISLATSSPASNTAITTADYDQVGTTKLATDINVSSLSTSAYNTWTLNSTGLSNVSKTGVTKLSLRHGQDLNNESPASGGYNGINGARWADQAGTTEDPKLIVEHHTGNNAPSAPDALLVEGQADALWVSDNTPEFSAVYKDADSGDLATHYRIQVSTSPTFTSVHWDSGTTTMATTTAGQRSADLSYAGSALASSTVYYWRIKFSDDEGATGAWSATSSSFILAEPITDGAIQDISFTYDANGNITNVVDVSDSEAWKVVAYTYDDLNRLLTASTSAASTTAYRHQFAYSMLGNITGMSTSSATTTYTYAETSYANPHAATSVGGATLTYDNNGNVTAIGSLDYTWDWRNRLASAERTGGGITTYGYDHTGQRVFKATGTATTSYPNKYFNLATTTGAATTTKHIFSPGGELLATVVGASTTASTTYLHLDHLGGTNVATDEDGKVTQTLDYYPYGSQRIAAGASSEQRKFTGHEHDQENDLTYANARYYEQNVAKWLSQDPASRDNPEQFLTDPQQLNSYAYGRNNPLRFLDQSGEVTFEFSRRIAGPLGFLASHNAIAGYNVPGFPKGLMTIGGYNPSSWFDGPFGNDLITMVGSSAANDLASGDYQLAQQIISGDASGARGLSLINDFGGLTEGEYWKSLLEGAAAINAESGPYNSLSRNSHSALNSMKNYANPGSTSFKPTWQLTPAAGVNVMPGHQTGSASSASSRSSGGFGLSADTRITSDNVGAFISFISQFLR